jgi:hypothetical protein
MKHPMKAFLINLKVRKMWALSPMEDLNEEQQDEWDPFDKKVTSISDNKYRGKFILL